MIPARKNVWIERWFRHYVRGYLRRSFHRVFVTGEPPRTPEGPLLVCINHSSWWDLLFAFWLSQDVLGWDSYGAMDERQLRRYGILSRIGVFGVDRETLEGGREFLEYTHCLLDGRPRVLWLTPQGEMVSNTQRPVRFYSGVAHLARALGDCSVTTVALDYEFWDEKRPEAFVHFGPVQRVDPARSRRDLLADLQERLERQMDDLQALRVQRDPTLFRVALSGGGGISPVYDLLRTAAAWTRRERFESEHGAVVSAPRWGHARKGADR